MHTAPRRYAILKFSFPVLSPGFYLFLGHHGKASLALPDTLRPHRMHGLLGGSDKTEGLSERGEERINERTLREAEMIVELLNKGVRWPD